MRLHDLTGQQRLIVLLVAGGWRYDDIAQALCITRRTVQVHAHLIARRLSHPEIAPRTAIWRWVWQQQPEGVGIPMRRGAGCEHPYTADAA